MKLLVTGGAGFIGSNFIRYWLAKYPKDYITNLDKLTYAGHLENLKDLELSSKYQFIKGDIINQNVVEKAIKDVDIVVHFAAETHVDRSIEDPMIFAETNVLGTCVLLDACLRHSRKRFHHVSCFDYQTMAFTKRGLKDYKQIKVGDLVLSINPIDRNLEWKPVEKVIIQDYSGKMVKVKTKTVDLLVTPNHRMLFQEKKSKKLKFKEATNMKHDSINKLPMHYKWLGNFDDKLNNFFPREDFVYLLGVFIGDGYLSYQQKLIKNTTGLSKLEYMQIGRNEYGQFMNMGRVGSLDYSISQSWRIFLDIPSKNNCRKRCERALTNLGIKWHAHAGRAGEHLYFTSKEYFEIFKECGKGARSKQIPEWALELPKDLLKLLFLGLMDSDGTKGRVFFTSSEKLAHQFMELCVKLNFSPTLSTRHSKSYIGDRKIEGDSYVVSVGMSNWRDIRRHTVSDVDYNGKIWCLKVKDNKNFLTYRNGRTVFCGNTDEVYGELGPKDPPFSEKTPYDPKSPYSASKASSDFMVKSYFTAYGLPITITNCGNNYGPYQDPEKLIPNFITKLFTGNKVPLAERGQNIRSWLSVEDHCRAIETVIKKGKIGQSYCVGGEEKTNLEVTKKILKIMNKDESWIEYSYNRAVNDFRYALDDSKIRKLGWKPKYNFDHWLEETIKWYQENEWWWKPLIKPKRKWL